MFIIPVLIIILITLFQLSVEPVLFGVFLPNFLLVIVLTYAFSSFYREALWGAFIGGLALDLFSVSFLGINAFAFLLAAQFTFMMRGFVGERQVLKAFIIVFFSFLFRLIPDPFTQFTFTRYVFFNALLDGAVYIVISPLILTLGEKMLGGKDLQLQFKFER